jgi:hypothetical protein
LTPHSFSEEFSWRSHKRKISRKKVQMRLANEGGITFDKGKTVKKLFSSLYTMFIA